MPRTPVGDRLASLSNITLPGMDEFNCKYYSISEFDDIKHKNYFSIISQNVRSLHANYDNFKQFHFERKNHNFSIIALQELWRVEGSNFILDGYSDLEYKTRERGEGGGIGFYIKQEYDYEILEDLSDFEEGLIECLFIKVITKKNTSNNSPQ